MIMKVVGWIKSHKLIIVLGIVIIYLLEQQSSARPLYLSSSKSGRSTGISSEDMALPAAGEAAPMAANLSMRQEAAPSASKDRLVITETYMSLVVKDVPNSLSQIQQKAEGLGGFLINSHLSKPEESASGTISIRVPKEKLSEALAAFRSYGLRVVDENVSGRDVTDQYEDIDAKLETLNKTRVKFEEILNKAVSVQDILTVQRELVSLQSQIDYLKGQQQYLSKSAELSKITIYLSTDEFSLPYAPKEAWRPNVILKQAVRALVINFRKVGTAFIWIAVFTPLWLPVLIIAWFINKKKKFL